MRNDRWLNWRERLCCPYLMIFIGVDSKTESLCAKKFMFRYRFQQFRPAVHAT
jgi:hypothetical protein